MRVDEHADRGERRDAIDQRLIKLLYACNLLPILIPNDLKVAINIVNTISMGGLLLSGGNAIGALPGADAHERDEVENELISLFIKRKLPIMGICRGMQAIQSFYGVPLKEVSGHVACYHAIKGQIGKRIVNSFHDYGSTDTVPTLSILASGDDGVIEAVSDAEKKILAIMWHPERENTFAEDDIDLLKKHFHV